MKVPHKVRAGGPTVAVESGTVFDGWQRKRFQTLRIGTWRTISGPTAPWTQGSTELVLRLRIGDVQRQRAFHLGPLEELTIDVSQASDAYLEIKSSDLAGYDLLTVLDDEPVAGHVDTQGRWYEFVAVAGDYTCPAGAVRAALTAPDAGWRWLGRVSQPPGTTLAIVENAGFIEGSVKGTGYRTSVANLGIAWTINF